jgi:hypothetical protein
MKPKKLQPDRSLRRSIKLAHKLERIASNKAMSKPLGIIGYGFLVRNQRLASAILSLPSPYSYEALILIRTMLEIYINYSWIRLKNKHSRAIRFLSYEPIDRWRCAESMTTTFTPAQRKQLKAECFRTRHLFRFRDNKGKMQWARSWATVSSLEGRLREVRSSVPPAPVDNYLYGVYRWISSIVHGGPQSLTTVLTGSGILRPSKQPLSNPFMPIWVAHVLLVSLIDIFAEDLRMTASLQPELSRLIKQMNQSANIAP